MAKVTILALTLGRPDMTRQTWQTNLNNTGCDYDLFWFDNGSSGEDMRELIAISQPYKVTWFEWVKENQGISKAFNEMIVLAFARGAEYVVTMANDIVEPDNWVQKRVAAAQAIDKTGVVAIPVEGGARYHRKTINGITIDNGQVIGNWLITKTAYEAIGLLCEGYGIYGPIDLDYCDRLEMKGILSYYLSDQLANHIGKPSDNPKGYQEAKDKSLRVAWEKYKRNKIKYRRGVDLYQHHLSEKYDRTKHIKNK